MCKRQCDSIENGFITKKTDEYWEILGGENSIKWRATLTNHGQLIKKLQKWHLFTYTWNLNFLEPNDFMTFMNFFNKVPLVPSKFHSQEFISFLISIYLFKHETIVSRSVLFFGHSVCNDSYLLHCIPIWIQLQCAIDQNENKRGAGCWKIFG